MDRKSIISELTSSYNWRRAENWLMTITIVLMILALAAGIDYSLDPGANFVTELLVWGGALVWVLIFTIAHTRTMNWFARNEKRVIKNLESGDEFKYSQKRESSTGRLIVVILALIIAVVLIVISTTILLNTQQRNDFPLELTAEMTVIIFAAILAIISALIRIFPLRYMMYSIKVSTLGNEPTILYYKIRRENQTS